MNFQAQFSLGKKHVRTNNFCFQKSSVSKPGQILATWTYVSKPLDHLVLVILGCLPVRGGQKNKKLDS